MSSDSEYDENASEQHSEDEQNGDEEVATTSNGATTNADDGDKPVTWQDLGLVEPLIEAVNELKWKTPSKIQREAIPVALQGNDIIALAETGNEKRFFYKIFLFFFK